MLLGVDVGGTHTDAVLLELAGASFTVAARAKVETDGNDVVASVRAALEAVLAGRDAAGVTRFTLSTTLTTNALAQERFDDALLVLIPGPGMAVESWTGNLPVQVVSGAMDHRGRETLPLDEAACAALARKTARAGVGAVGVAGKFAPRNPAHENSVARIFRDNAAPGYASLSHKLSGRLNFPRRAVAAFYNAALWRLHASFADAVKEACAGLGLALEPLLLMAHGGSVPLDASRELCVEAANSGPAASVLGIMALEGERFGADEAVLFCDIGGSTTDLALMAGGSPVTAPDGLVLGNRRTSVPGLATLSVPVGGDSPLRVAGDGGVCLFPRRTGPGLALGGAEPTLTDALNVLGHAAWGDAEASRRGLRDFAERLGPPATPESAAQAAVDAACRSIREAAGRFVAEINARPVFTVAQLLEGAAARPGRICAVGGAGPSMALPLEKAFGLPVTVPGHAAVANAIGAALARTSAFVSLYADTSRRVAYLSPEGEQLAVPSSFSLGDAVAEVERRLRRRMAARDPDSADAPVETVESDSFLMHDAWGERVGRSIRVLCRVKPGLMTERGARPAD
ncbi:MAG: hydantoinase/oxoprolinase family protein [Deltaproteobacteria bacterium]|jgi:N-methylhydantoinase A/oxoprolinase/acetone carboxylase beta subunit|nr:hydantoinase/oxoprolinase family protein [Deltaproteobacteria bacterium]